ncbi:hypothetical protein BDZ88DRAFT_300060 [Geranomyces variabilis]|nr:hypothetical protein BDZ88DRAFT_300060 [Geranomyces variabilis]KAJ3132170.1 hypothetical protein HDU90_007476 [Geranomyces variabilis]
MGRTPRTAATTYCRKWCFTLFGLVRRVITEHLVGSLKHRPLVFVINSGLWAKMTLERFNGIYDLFNPLETDVGYPRAAEMPLLIWKTTTPIKETPLDDKSYESDMALEGRDSPHFAVVDTREIFQEKRADRPTDETFWDGVHFRRLVYHEFTHVMADFIATHECTGPAMGK